MTRENVYLLLLLLLHELKQSVGRSCVSTEKRNNYNYHYNQNVYAVNTTCRYQMMYNPHQYNLKPEYTQHYASSVVLNVTTIISSSLISKIQRDTFTGASTLISLTIENSQISEIANGAWNGFVALKILKLPHNNLTTLKDNTFSSLVLLEELKIPNNKLQTLETDAFAKLIHLKILDLSFNNISKINHTFDSLKSLKELDVSHNTLTSLKSLSFQKMDSLIKINLSKNEIFMVEESAFIGLHQLKQIDLSNNKITKIDSGAFKNLESISIIYLYNNNITELRAFEDLQSLTKMNVDNNALPKIEKTDFQKHSKLIELSLRENRIQSVDIGSFGELHILTRLDLSKNLLTSINTGTFSGLHALQLLNISRNHIDTIAGFPFHNIPEIKNLDLSRNELNYFDPSDLPQSSTLDIQGNPVSCSALTDVLKKLGNVNAFLVRGDSYGENSIHGIPCEDDERISKPLNAENPLETYLERDFKNSNFVKYFEDRFQTDSENKLMAQIFKNFTNATLSSSNDSVSALTSISNKLDELIKNKSINQKILELLNLNKNRPLLEKQNAKLEQLIDLLDGENKSKNEYFAELVMIMKNTSIPEKEKMGNSKDDGRLIQAIIATRHDLYILAVTNITIIMMLGMFMTIFIYFKCRTFRRRGFRDNAEVTYSNELKPIVEC